MLGIRGRRVQPAGVPGVWVDSLTLLAGWFFGFVRIPRRTSRNEAYMAVEA